MNDFWIAAVTLCGLAGVACFVFYSLYKKWLSLPIFPKLKQDQAFSLFKTFLYLTFGLAVLTLILWLVDKQLERNNRTVTTPAPVEFETHVTRRNYGLPENVFGGIQDAGKGREWLESLDASAKVNHGEDAIPLWLYTEPFEGSHGTFTAHVDVGTQDGIDIQAFRIWNNTKLHRESLNKLDGQGPRMVYRFDVETSQKDDRLLVFMGMSKDTYEKIPKDHRFTIRSKPRQVR